MKSDLTMAFLVPVHGNSKQEIKNFLYDASEQTFQEFEIFFVFEKSSFNFDFEQFVRLNVPEKIKKNEICYIAMENNLGIGFALHYGVKKIKTDIVIRADIGDRMRKDRLSRIYEAFKKNSIDVVYSQAFLKTPRSKNVSSYARNLAELKKSFIFRNAICHPTVAFNRNTVCNSGSYDKKMRYCEDLDLWLRLIKSNANFYLIDEPLVEYNVPENARRHENWHYNFKVRLKNIGSPNLIYSMIGIIFVGAYCLLPKNIKEKIYAFAKK